MTKQNEKDAKRVPELRFKGFTDDWEQRKLGDLGSVQMNKRIFKDQTSESGEVPFFKIGTFGKKPDSFISKKLFDEYKSKYPYPKVGDILISASGSIGRTVVYKGEDAYFQDSNIVWLEHDGRLKNSFLEQFLKRTKWNKIEGSTIKRLYNKDILNKKINLPKLKEQEKIGQLFQYFDKTITLHEEQHRQLEQLKKALLQKMFADETGYPALRFKGFTEKWEQRKLGETVVNIVAGGDINKAELLSKGKYPVYANALTNNGIVGYYASQYRIAAPAVTVTGRGDIGIAKARDINFTPVVRLLAISSQHNNYFLENLINTHRSFAESTGVPQLTVPQLSNYKLYFPQKINEEVFIGKLFKKMDHLTTLHQHKIDNLKRLKRALLQKMFV
ncbi:hypothetical protein LBLM1_03880 [Limosilactobacillus mucosae LM1]|uniref:Type I restriction modification DNA specificity domain-containing protein n=1 Tax=Limosilactobacillus mucosae LM1 TaxID=1130798 RepID=A0A0D4CJD7_LIMMU|nr:restriction endonuclease subunit S [Limosilactobacillus mucosae]AJT50277.1 hypothetical protein LBLM1_03880 [Limosilactobacillus mucosae LM1]